MRQIIIGIVSMLTSVCAHVSVARDAQNGVLDIRNSENETGEYWRISRERFPDYPGNPPIFNCA